MRIALVVVAGLAVVGGILHAQSDDEDEMDYFPLVPTGNTLQFGLRYIGGPRVSFGQLGSVPMPGTISIGDPTGAENRVYNDGSVLVDSRKDANGNPVSDGLTNYWTYNFDSQVTSAGDIAFHAYSADTLGAGLSAKRSNSSGWELQIGKVLGKLGGKVEVSLVGGFSFNSIQAKISSSVPATLTTVTDVYPLYGQSVPAAPYSAPSVSNQYVYDANGNPVLNSDGTPKTNPVDTSTILGNQPTRTTTTSTTNVQGYWQIKGAYYTFRLGPMFRFPLTERLKLSLGVGAALAYVGTEYIAQESVDLTDVMTPLQTANVDTHNKMLPAYYADADAEYWLTERTGLYLGASFQKSGSVNQTLDGRTAVIDLGSTYGIQSGFTLRF